MIVSIMMTTLPTMWGNSPLIDDESGGVPLEFLSFQLDIDGIDSNWILMVYITLNAFNKSQKKHMIDYFPSLVNVIKTCFAHVVCGGIETHVGMAISPARTV